MKDLAVLVDELHLVFVIAVTIWLPAAGDHVVGQLVRGGGYARSLARGDGCRLLLQLIEQRSAGARCGLVAGDDDPTQTKLFAKRLEHHGERNRRAVRTCDDPLVIANVLAVDLGHNQRHVRLHSPARTLPPPHRTALTAPPPLS